MKYVWQKRKKCLANAKMAPVKFSQMSSKEVKMCGEAKKMQLDVEVSPPANRMSLRLTLTHVTFDLLCITNKDGHGHILTKDTVRKP